MSVHALKAYQSVATDSRCATADKRDLVVMMYDGAINAIRLAAEHASRREDRAAGTAIARAVTVVSGLRDTLDKVQGGAVAEHLDDFYCFVIGRLMNSTAASRPTDLVECEDLLSQVREAWSVISPATAGAVNRRMFLVKS